MRRNTVTQISRAAYLKVAVRGYIPPTSDYSEGAHEAISHFSPLIITRTWRTVCPQRTRTHTAAPAQRNSARGCYARRTGYRGVAGGTRCAISWGMKRKQNGNRVTIEGVSRIGDLAVECYEVRDGLEVFVGYMYPGMAAAWLRG